MATYKKRGYKKPQPKADGSNEEELYDGDSTTAEVFNTLDEKASKTEAWVAKNQNAIFTVIAVIIVAVLGYLAYHQFVGKPAQTEAMNDMYQAQKYYDDALATPSVADSLYTLALNGGEGKYGMLDIIDEHSGTKAANLANYYAGMAYLHLNDYKNAVTYLGDFSSDDEILAPQAKGAIGDAFSQLNQLEDALEYYDKAAKLKTNNFTTPLFLYKAGITALDLGEANKALTYFNTIKADYPKADEAKSIDVLIGKAQASK